MMNTEVIASQEGTFENVYTGSMSGSTAPAAWFFDWATGANGSDAGVSVNSWTMLQLCAIWQGINLIAGDLGQIPVRLVKDKFDNQEDHAAWFLLRNAPNEQQTPAVWKETMMQWLILYGNAVSHVVRDRAGRPREVIPLHPDWLWPNVVDYDGLRPIIHYHYTSPYGGGEFVFTRDEVLHFKGLGDGHWGYALFDVGKQCLGHGIALQKFGNASFKNAARPSGLLKMAGKASEESRRLLREDFERMHSGADNANRVAILPENIDYMTISQTNEQSQWIEAKRMARQEAASLLNLPLPMLNSFEDSPARATLEEMRTQYLQQTLTRYFNLWSQEMSKKLLSYQEFRSGKYEFVWDTSEFMKGDIETMAQVHSQLITSGIENPNEARESFGKKPYEGGDEYGSPHINPKSDEEPPEREPAEATGGGENAMKNAKAAHRRLLSERLRHVVQREYAAVRESAKGAKNFVAWLDDYYLGGDSKPSKVQHLAQTAAGNAVDACESIGLPAGAIYTAIADYAAMRHRALLKTAELATQEQLPSVVELALEAEPESVAEGLLASALGIE